MNNFLQRIIFGALYVFILIQACKNPIYLTIIFFIVATMGTIELKIILNKINQSFDLWPTLIIGTFTYFSIIQLSHLGILVLGLTTYFIILTLKAKTNTIVKLGNLLFTICYIFSPLALTILIGKYDGNYNSKILISLLILIWASDSWAYLLGSMFGKRKLFEKLSPNKTWEGFIGSFILTCSTGIILGLNNFGISLFDAIILGGITVIFGTIGDLFQSMLKRMANLKDSGNILPGHGGILDRFDSILFCFPAYYIYFSLCKPLINYL